MMMTFVNMDAPGITILPTHRVASTASRTSPAATSSPRPPTTSPSPSSPTTPQRPLPRSTPSSAASITPGIAFLAVTGDGNYLLTPRPGAIAPLLRPAPTPAPARRHPAPHRILDKLLGLNEETVRAGRQHPLHPRSRRSPPACRLRQRRRRLPHQARHPRPDEDVSLSGEVMPQKSTDFYPKLLSGLAIYALD